MSFSNLFVRQLSTSCVLGLSLLCLSAGCGGGTTEEDKKAAEKAPDLELGETESTTSDQGAPEKKETVEGEEKK